MDRLSSVRVEGFRAIEDVTLDLTGLTVLVGENGSGKSTLLEALELLSKAATSPAFVREALAAHGRLSELIRFGAQNLRLSAEISADDVRFSYVFSLVVDVRGWVSISDESLTEHTELGPRQLIWRLGATTRVVGDSGQPVDAKPSSEQLVLSYFGSAAPRGIARVQRVLAAIRIHTAFDSLPVWLAFEQQRKPAMRSPVVFQRAEQLERLGANLPNIFNTLKNDVSKWRDVLADVRAGLGSDVTDVVVNAVGRGDSELAVKFAHLPQPVPASALSDGQLGYLALVALRHSAESASVIGFDEPETHLHPALLARCVFLFEAIAKIRPMVVATHSDTLLNLLQDPVKQVRVCRLDASRRVELLSLDRSKLDRFRKEFGEIGELRREGLLESVLADGGAAQ